MHPNRLPGAPADQQRVPDGVIGFRVALGPLDEDVQGGPVSDVAGIHQALHPVDRLHELRHDEFRDGRDVLRYDLPRQHALAEEQEVEVGEVLRREPLADEECVLDFLHPAQQQQGDLAHAALGTPAQVQAARPIRIASSVDEHLLTLSQREFLDVVRDWCRAPRKLLLVVSGGPGTGKSYCVREILRHVEAEQIRMSFTAVSAEAICGRTIHSTVNLDWSKNSLCAILEARLKDETDLLKCIEESSEIVKAFSYHGHPRIVVVDEVSMVNGWLMYWLVRFFMDRTDEPLLFVAMGDRHQLNPVKSIHNLFSVTSWGPQIQVRRIALSESKRFVPEFGRLIDRLRDYVDADDAKGFFRCVRERFPVVESIDGTLLRQADRAMAFRNDRVKKFNAYYIKHMVAGPEIELGGDLVVKPGCLVFVTKNGFSSAKNGTLLRFQRRDVGRALCTYPDTNKAVSVSECEPGVFPLDVGFASTVHKFQGSTISEAKIVIHFDNFLDLNLVYTALSRVRSMNQILAVSGIPNEDDDPL